ncbi:MAG: putative metallopeptidase [Candidatus Aenigmatarchaeota archaeon]
MKYVVDYETQNVIKDIIEKLNLNHIKFEKLICIKSVGSKSKRTIARIHGLPKIMQVALNSKAFYVIEIISENFDKLSYEDKIKTLIHELMHIPKNFGGGFRGHRNFVTRKKVEEKFKEYLNFIQ